MPRKDTPMAITREEKKGWWGHIRDFIKTNTSLAVIIAAALLLERELMDSINYERLEGKNVLTLGKSLKLKV